MTSFFQLILADYRQRTRSYAFLITLAISVYVAYAFIPAPDASYTTVRIGNFRGLYNAAWIGHVTALMTSTFLSLVGFFLVNNSVKRDIETGVGQIIATTPISNFSYLFSKALSNYLVLLSITAAILLMSIGIYFYRGEESGFHVSHFIIPYSVIVLPSLFFISCLAVVAEVLLGRKSVLQHIGFFIFFNVTMATIQTAADSANVRMLDPLGTKAVLMGIKQTAELTIGSEAAGISMGFNFSDKLNLKTFIFSGVHWPTSFLLSRLVWITFGLFLVYVSSHFFHRFDFKESNTKKSKKKNVVVEGANTRSHEIKLSLLPKLAPSYGIVSIIKTEFLLLVRRGPHWFWLINLGGMIALIFAPIEIAHQFILPILWFLQVTRLSDMMSKEKANRIHYFTFSAYKPLQRLFTSQIFSSYILLILLALPLCIKLVVAGGVLSVLSIITGALFIVSFATISGLLSGGKKLFEILFFALTYANVNRIPFADYFGGTVHTTLSVQIVGFFALLFLFASVLVRKWELRNS